MNSQVRIIVSKPIRLAVGITIIALSGYFVLDSLYKILRLFMAYSAFPPLEFVSVFIFMILIMGCSLFVGFRVVRPNHSNGDAALFSQRGWKVAGIITLILGILLCIIRVSFGVPLWRAVLGSILIFVIFGGLCFKAARDDTAKRDIEHVHATKQTTSINEKTNSG